MTKTSKSPVRVAREALAVGARVLRRYAHRNSPRRFTQPQLFACLVLKTFFKTDYRGIAQLLVDLTELRTTLGLESVPHFTTLHKASRRLLRLPRANRLLTAIVRRALGRRRTIALAAFDSTGLDCGHISSYYVKRRSRVPSVWQTTTYTGFAKLEAAVDCASHLIIAHHQDGVRRQIDAPAAWEISLPPQPWSRAGPRKPGIVAVAILPSAPCRSDHHFFSQRKVRGSPPGP